MTLKNDNITSIEQNSRLLNIGLGKKYADENLEIKGQLLIGDDSNHELTTYAFSLTGLINLLPKDLKINGKHYTMFMSHYDLAYGSLNAEFKFSLYHSIMINRSINDDTNPYIEMIVKMLEFLASKNLLDINKKEQN